MEGVRNFGAPHNAGWHVRALETVRRRCCRLTSSSETLLLQARERVRRLENSGEGHLDQCADATAADVVLAGLPVQAFRLSFSPAIQVPPPGRIPPAGHERFPGRLDVAASARA